MLVSKIVKMEHFITLILPLVKIALNQIVKVVGAIIAVINVNLAMFQREETVLYQSLEIAEMEHFIKIQPLHVNLVIMDVALALERDNAQHV